jgi:hypothetical protein
MNISLPNGKFISMNIEDWLAIPDDKLDEFYQNCIADDLGDEIDPFNENVKSKLNIQKEIDDEPESE